MAGPTSVSLTSRILARLMELDDCIVGALDDRLTFRNPRGKALTI
jgi:hypothetical protein